MDLFTFLSVYEGDVCIIEQFLDDYGFLFIGFWDNEDDECISYKKRFQNLQVDYFVIDCIGSALNVYVSDKEI